MTELVRLHRDPIVEGAHIVALPAWIPPVGRRPDAYWHQPRSGNLRPDGRITIMLWCGQIRYIQAAAIALTSTPPPGLRCGTCVGRRLGYDRVDGLIFRPRDHWQLPKVCPCTEPDPNDWHLCAACGRKTNAAGGWNAYGLARHPPDPALAERHQPCPRHGWSRAHWRDGHLICTAWGCA